MNCFKRSGLISVFLLFLGAGFDLHAQCGQPDAPLKTPVWNNFEQFVEEEYLKNRRFEVEDLVLIWGHALGRVASGTEGVRDGKEAFDCLVRGLDQIITTGRFVLLEGYTDTGGGLASARVLYARLQEASMGMHDQRVAQVTGVSSTDPAPQVYGSVSGGHTGSWEALNDPAYSGATPTTAGNPQPAQSSGGATPRRIDCDLNSGHLEHVITGEMVYGRDDPRARRFPDTPIKVIGDATERFEWDKVIDHLRENLDEAGKRHFVWLENGQWGHKMGDAPYLACGKGATGAGQNDGPALVLDKVTIANNGRHRERLGRGSWEKVYEYTMKEGALDATSTFTWSNDLVSHLRWHFEFTVPPKTLEPGATVPIRLYGEISGHSNAIMPGVGLSFYAGTNANDKIASIGLHQNDMQDVRRLEPSERKSGYGKWHYGGGATETAKGEVVIPNKPSSKFAFEANGPEGLSVRWDYTLQSNTTSKANDDSSRGRQSASIPTPVPGAYNCSGGWGGMVITDSRPGYARGTYTDTYDKSAKGWIELRAPQGGGLWGGEWGEAKLNRRGRVTDVKMQDSSFSGRWHVSVRGSQHGNPLPKSSGRLSCSKR